MFATHFRRKAVRRGAVAIGAAALLATTWGGVAASAAPGDSPSKAGVPSVSSQNSGEAPAAQSGTKWCGWNYDTCVQERNAFRHYGHNVGPITWAGSGNTCPPESSCNGYYFDWWI